MRAFKSGNYLLSEAKLEVRLVYTGFLLLALVGFGTTAAFQLFHIGATPAHIAAYFRGGESGDVMTFAKTPRELMEATHFHAFTMGRPSCSCTQPLSICPSSTAWIRPSLKE